MTATLSSPRFHAETVAEVIDRLGVPPDRILVNPPLGTATEADRLRMETQGRLCELVDGTLVEKAVGSNEASVEAILIALLVTHCLKTKIGVVLSPSGPYRLVSGLVRLPDVSFISWSRLPAGKLPADPIINVAPDLAIEVLSKSNTPAEMNRKRREYFDAGVRLVWEIDFRSRSAAVYAPPNTVRHLTESDSLDGGGVLPEFSVRVSELFAELDRASRA